MGVQKEKTKVGTLNKCREGSFKRSGSEAPNSTKPLSLPSAFSITYSGAMDREVSRSQLRYLFWGAAVLAIVLSYIPFGGFVLYPFSLLATWAHEMGHGLTAEIVGGDFRHLELYVGLGGVAHSTRPATLLAPPLIAAGGLLAPSIAGGAVVYFGARGSTARWIMEGLGVLLILSALLWVRNGFGFAATLGLGAAALAIGRYATELVEVALAQFVGIRLCLESLSDVDYMFTKQFLRGGEVMSSDSQTIAEHLGLTYWVWGGLIAMLTVVILVGAYLLAWGSYEPAD